jgi:hypothetical protein
VLTANSYTEFIAHLYSQPTFSFRDWNSFAVFVGSMLPARFESIQSVCVHQTQGLRRHQGRAEHYTYKTFHDRAISVRNSVLPNIPFQSREWVQTELILRKMPALQEVTVVFFLEPMVPWSGSYVPYTHIVSHMDPSIFKTFWAARTAEKWEDFEVIIDDNSQPNCSVKKLRRRRVNI